MKPFRRNRADAPIACAIVAVRDEERHIEELIRFLSQEGLDVVILDDGSIDGTVDVAEFMRGCGVIAVHRRPRANFFSMTDLLSWKAVVATELPHQWFLHVDADEWLQSPGQGERLVDFIARAEASGANCVNFQEFTFIPEPDVSEAGPIREALLRYYHFAPSKVRLVRAFKRELIGKNIEGAGHLVVADNKRIFEECGFLRHYPVLGVSHLMFKYGHRVFDPTETAKGWHHNRLGLARYSLEIIDNGALRTLVDWKSKNFDQSVPTRYHFWQPEWADGNAI